MRSHSNNALPAQGAWCLVPSKTPIHRSLLLHSSQSEAIFQCTDPAEATSHTLSLRADRTSSRTDPAPCAIPNTSSSDITSCGSP